MIQKIISGIIALCIMVCFDAMMNHITKDLGWFWIITTTIGRFAIGWFSCMPLYRYILKRLTND